MAIFKLESGIMFLKEDFEYLLNSVDPDNVYINSYLRNYVLNNISFDLNSIYWRSANDMLNPKYVIKAVSKAAKENTAGVSPLGNLTSLESYFVPKAKLVSNRDSFVIINSEVIGFVAPNKSYGAPDTEDRITSFLFIGVINPKGSSVPYIYVYSQEFIFSVDFDSRLTKMDKDRDSIFFCFPVGIDSFHNEDNHNLYISFPSSKQKITLRLVVGYSDDGYPIYANFGFSTGIDNFDDCWLSNGFSKYSVSSDYLKSDDFPYIDSIEKLLPNDLSLVNAVNDAQPRNVNTLNDITNIKLLDVFIRDIDSKPLYKFFSHINNLAYCSSYHFFTYFLAKIDYPVTGAKWFLLNQDNFLHMGDDTSVTGYLNVHNQGLAVYDNDYIYFSATDMQKAGIPDILSTDVPARLPFIGNAKLPKNIFGVDISTVHNFNCVYVNDIPDGSMVILAYSSVYTIFYGNNDNIYSKLIFKDDLKNAAKAGSTFNLISENGFSMSISFYSNLWYILVPVSYNCVVFDIYKYTSFYDGGDHSVVSSLQ